MISETSKSALGPVARPRRLRRTDALRALVRETTLEPSSLVQPLFVAERPQDAVEIASMPGIRRYQLSELAAEARELDALGIPAVIVFGLPAFKDAVASRNLDPKGLIPEAVRALKAACPQMLVMADLCNCEYTDHGHCGILGPSGDVDNDRTLRVLAQTALAYAAAGVDFVAPSDMMDGRVAAIRTALDGEGHIDVGIMSYAVKYASAFYGPFREAAGSTPRFGDRRTYQMDVANAREALRESALDVAEGADIILVKPALPYLDVVRTLRDAIDVPLAVYSVSGEYAMVKAAAQRGWIDEKAAVDEMLLSCRRAGAQLIVTYFAKQYALQHAR